MYRIDEKLLKVVFVEALSRYQIIASLFSNKTEQHGSSIRGMTNFRNEIKQAFPEINLDNYECHHKNGLHKKSDSRCALEILNGPEDEYIIAVDKTLHSKISNKVTKLLVDNFIDELNMKKDQFKNINIDRILIDVRNKWRNGQKSKIKYKDTAAQELVELIYNFKNERIELYKQIYDSQLACLTFPDIITPEDVVKKLKLK